MGLFGFKKAPERAASDAPTQPQVIVLQSGHSAAIIRYNESIAAHEAMHHPIVSRALNRIAQSVQQVPWVVQEDPKASSKGGGNKKALMGDIQSLLDSPTNDLTPAMLRYWMALNYACYGRIPLKISFSASDKQRPNGIYPLEARYVHATLNARGVPTMFEYGTGPGKSKEPAQGSAKPGEAFIGQIWKPALKGFQDKNERNSPLQSVGLPSEVIKALLIRAIQTANGHPNVRYLVTTEKTLTNDQVEALKAHLNEDHGPGGADAGRVPILQQAGKIEIHTLDNDLSDIHSKTPSDDMARLIFGAFDIPIALAGIGGADAAKFAGNYSESRATFWEDTIIPGYVTPICEGLTQMLCPPGLVIKPDLDGIPALQASRVKGMKEVSGVTFLTATEKRAMYGYEPTDKIPETSPTIGGNTNVQS